MKRVGATAALVVLACVGHAHADDRPDYFASLRLPAFLEDDRSFVARESKNPEAPPAFRARKLLIRLKAYGDAEKRWWPKRELLLIEMANGDRWAAEIAGVLARDAERSPFLRLASSAGGSVVFWNLHERDWWTRLEKEVERGQPTGHGSEDGAPCARDGWYRVEGAAASIEYAPLDWRSRTVRRELVELRSRTFAPEQVAQLVRLRQVDPTGDVAAKALRTVRLAWNLIFPDRPGARSEDRTLTLEPAPQTLELATFRSLTEIPANMQPYLADYDPVFDR